MIKNIIFDLDNTIIEDRDEYILYYKEALINCGYSEENYLNIYNAFEDYEHILDEKNRFYSRKTAIEFLNKKLGTNYDIKLIDEINNSSEKTLVLVSEGAKEKNANLAIDKLSEKINRKVRSLVVGHPSQSNNMTSVEAIERYEQWVDETCKFIAEDPYSSYCIANIDGSYYKKPIDYYAKLNPYKGQKAELSEELKELICSYMAK